MTPEREGSGTKFTIDRKIFSSDIWLDSPWKLKIWIYLIGNANHAPGKYMGIPIKRGQFIRSYRTIAKDCAYKVGYRLKKPSLDTIRRICEELTKEQRIVRRTVHCGTLFTIINYNELQAFPEPRTVRRTRESSYTHRTKQEGVKNVTPPNFSFYLKRYSDRKSIDLAFKAIASTRKYGKVTDSILISQLQKWERYPVDQVESGIHTYLEKNYAGQGKREGYLLGIIRKSKNQPTPASVYEPPPVYTEEDVYGKPNPSS